MRLPQRFPSLGQRHAELKSQKWPGSTLVIIQGRVLIFRFKVAPTPMGRIYRCILKVYPSNFPELFVIDPDPKVLAEGRALPHVYPYKGHGIKLCLWLPRAHEWMPQMRLSETYIPWAAEWLNYFEEWLVTDVWAGGGVHPEPKMRKS